MAAAEGNPYKVILVGENHEDDLGEALTEVFGEFVNSDNLKKYGFGGESDFVFYYETPKTNKEVVFKYRNKLVKRTFLPLEDVTGVLSSGGNVFDSVVQESVPSVMTSIFYLLNWKSCV